MTSKLIPSNPNDVMVIRKVTENIATFSAPFARFGHIKIGGRGTVTKLASGSLAVFSPTALTPAVKDTISSMGTVKYITALDYEHHIYLGDWHEAYPEAKVIGMEGLAEKRKQQGTKEVPFSVIFTAKDKDTQSVDQEFDSEFDYEYVPSHANKELVFNFKREKTLIQADLIFNLPAIEQYSKSKENPQTGLATRAFTAFQTTKGMGQRRFVWWVASAGDRPAFTKSMEKIDKWDFDRIVPCHGDVIETGGKNVFRSIMQWFLQGQ